MSDPKVEIRLGAILSAVESATVEAMNATLLILGKTVRTTLSQPGTGRIYKVSRGRKAGRNLRAQGLHRASAPLRPPAVNTNRLRASWTVSTVPPVGGRVASKDGFVASRKDGSRIVLSYGSRVPYARMLETGTLRMRKRPYLAVAVPLVRSAAPRIFEKVFQRRFGPGAML